jgi:hypothetical protein
MEVRPVTEVSFVMGHQPSQDKVVRLSLHHEGQMQALPCVASHRRSHIIEWPEQESCSDMNSFAPPSLLGAVQCRACSSPKAESLFVVRWV